MAELRTQQTLRLEFDNVRIDPPGTAITNAALASTNIEADVRIFVGDRLFVDAPVLCVVEFASVLNAWLSSQPSTLSDFRFESADDDEPNILCISVSEDGLGIFSAWQKFSTGDAIGKQQAVAELRRFVRDVARRCQSELGVNVDHWIAASSR